LEVPSKGTFEQDRSELEIWPKEGGVRQAEKFGHNGMAEDLRLAIVRLDGRGGQV
jgi:hypothetical protein